MDNASTTTDYENQREKRKQTATAQQMRAANPEHCVWVEASAGTGKTKVLSDRVLRLLLNDVKPIRLLCLTYTKAAAVEMQSRITQRLSDWAVKDEASLDKDLGELLGAEINSAETARSYRQKARTLFAKLLDTPGGIKVQTIHSFCTDVLKRFPLEAGVSPYFEVLEDEEADNALAQIKSEILLKENSAANPRLCTALDFFTANMKESTFPKMLKKLTDNRRAMVKVMDKYRGLNGLLHALSAKLGINDDDSEISLKSAFMDHLRAKEEEIRANIQAWAHGTASTDQPKAEICSALIENGFQVSYYEAYKSCFYTTGNVPRQPSTLATKSARDADPQLMERLEAEILCIQALEAKLTKLQLYLSTKAAFTILSEINSRYENYKKAKSCMDFSDLIYKTRDLLKNSSARQWVLYKLDGGIDHILLDEAQDTSPEQWEIVASLSEDFFSGDGQTEVNRTIFVVGDRKQSIFSFQGADPTKFDEMAKEFKKKVEAAQKVFDPVTLEVSFRSAPAILEAVNDIFAGKDAADGVLPPEEKLCHLPSRSGEYGKVTILPFLEAEEKQKISSDETAHYEPSMERVVRTAADTKMAQEIAARIRRMIDESATSEHPLRYRDFMVLVRTRNAFVEEFIRACENNHVQISGADKIVLSEQIAIQDLISLGKFLLFPKDDLSLAEVLTSPLFSVEGQVLEDLCCEREKGEDLWSKMQKDSRCIDICNQLKTLFANLDYIRPYELFNFVLSQMGGRQKFIQRMGVEVEDALDEFINLTISYEQRQIPSLRGFISWFGQSEKEIKRECDEQETDAVRLLTVHHSKGLQAPIVFLPDTARIPTDKKEQNLLIDEDLAYYPLNAAAYDDNCLQLKDAKHAREMQEYRRLLYVALTRAEDQLFICAYGRHNAESWYELCRQAFAAENQQEDGSLVRISPEYLAKKQSKNSTGSDKKYAIEPWIFENLERESALAKPYTPSQADDEENTDSVSPLADNGRFYRRGTLIHKILQFLPQNSDDKAKAIDIFLQKNAADFSKDDCLQIKNEILVLLNNADFAEIFGPCSQSEVPIMGVVNDKIISAQIDRLVILPDKIKIVDFKTNRPPAKDVDDTPPQYLKQLAAYATLMQQIYPQKAVETYILWTNEARLMKVA